MRKPSPAPASEAAIPLRLPLFRGDRKLRIALVGLPRCGRTTLFDAVSSTAPRTGELGASAAAYSECTVQIGLDEASVVDLPGLHSLHHLEGADLTTLQYLLWGDQRPPVADHEGRPPAPFAPPDVIVQVVDASALTAHLELTLELGRFGRPLVLALNRMDEATQKGLALNVRALEQRLGVPVVPTVATMGHGIAPLFATAVDAARRALCPLPQPPATHIADALQGLSAGLSRPEIHTAFRMPHLLLLMQFAAADPYIESELAQHFPQHLDELRRLRQAAATKLPRPLGEELHADQHHRAALLYEHALRLGPPQATRNWRFWLDALFLRPGWGLLGSLAVFAAVLFVVFEVSGWIDAMTTARLAALLGEWTPASTTGVVARAIADGLVGLLGIVVPYMIPLVLLLVALEEMGLMHRIAFVVDRGFHRIGLHGGVAVPFLLGLGCNVPAISSAAKTTQGRERIIASVLITFVPCSARSAIILAIAGKYLGAAGVLGIFALTLLVIAVVGRLLSRDGLELGPGQVQDIPPYALPHWRVLVRETRERTADIVTIVTPLLVVGSIVLALLQHIGADQIVNTLLLPISHWWLGLPVVLGVPLLFGVLRKELSLLMIYQALGTQDVGAVLDWVQILTLLLFLSFYIPCVSTFAVMLKTLGRRGAFESIVLSVGVALLVSGALRAALTLVGLLAG